MKRTALPTRAFAVSNPLVWDLPKVGLLSAIYLDIQATVGGGPIVAPNALGTACIVNRVRLTANSGIDLINISGPGYHYLLRNYLEDYRDPVPFNAGAGGAMSVIALGAFDLSMFLPVALNARDPLGLIMLQNEQTLLQLSVQIEAAATVEAAATLTGTVTPYIEYFTVPVKKEDLPPLNLAHVIVEDQRAIPGAGAFQYEWQRGNTYIQVLHGVGINQAPADNWTAATVFVNQTDQLVTTTPAAENIAYGRSHGTTRRLGTLGIDFIGTDGLGTYGGARDLLDSRQVTELNTVIQAAAAGVLYTVRREFIQLL